MARDFLNEIIEESTKTDPDFGGKVESALARRVLARELADRRKGAGLTQTQVARRMRSTQPEVSKVERGADVRWSTIERYATAIGGYMQFVVGTPPVRRRRRAPA